MYLSISNLPFEDRMSSPQYTVYDVKVARFNLCNHNFNEIRPFVRKVFTTDDADRITQL